jgi:hypothetical protein
MAVRTVLLESVTLTVKSKVPAVVGVPLISPVAVFNVRTGGRLPEFNINV